MAQYGSTHSHPVPPAQNINTRRAQHAHGSAPWGHGHPTTHFPAAPYINSPPGSYGAPNSVLCQTADGIAGYMIWHGDPNAFPALAHIHYGTGPIDSPYSSYPPQTGNWNPMPASPPNSGLIPTQGFITQMDPALLSAPHQPGIVAQGMVPSAARADVPRVMPVPSPGQIDLLNYGQWQGQAVRQPETTATQTAKSQIIEPQPVSGSNIRAINLLTQAHAAKEPSYILSGKGQKRKIEEVTTINDECKALDVSGETHESSASKEATSSPETSPPILSSSVTSPDRNNKKSVTPKTPVKRVLATTCDVQPHKKRRTMDAEAKSSVAASPASTSASKVGKSPAIPRAIIIEDKQTTNAIEKELPGSATPKAKIDDAELPEALNFTTDFMLDEEMNKFFDFDETSVNWNDQPFWINEDTTQTGEHGYPDHPLNRFRQAEELNFSLNPWEDTETEMPLWAPW